MAMHSDRNARKYMLYLQLIVFFSSITTTMAIYIMADYYMDPGLSSTFGGSCGKRIEDASCHVASHLNPFNTWKYGSNVDCEITLDSGTMASAKFKIDWQFFKLQTGDCSADYLEVYDADMLYANATNLVGRFCGHNGIAVATPTDRYTTLKFHTDGSVQDKGFTLRATRYETPPCQSDEFLCVAENICIDSRLKCDGTEHCTDKTDEEGCSAWEKFIGGIISMGMGGMAGLGIGIIGGCVSVAVLIGAFTCCKNCCMKCCCWWPCCKGKFGNPADSGKVGPEAEGNFDDGYPMKEQDAGDVVIINEDEGQDFEYEPEMEGDASKQTKIASHGAVNDGLADVY